MATPPTGPIVQPGTFNAKFTPNDALPDIQATMETISSASSNDAVTDLAVPGTPGQFVTNFQTGAAFNTQELTDSRMELLNGVYLAPVAGPPGTPPEVIQVFAPYARRIVQGTAERVGGKPLIPNPTPTSANEILTSAAWTNAAHVIDPSSGIRIVRDSWLYFYVETFAPGSQFGPSTVPIPGVRLSFDLFPASLSAIDPGQFDSTIAPSV